MLRATYRKYTEDTISSYTDTLERSTLTVIDWNEGEIEEQRIYTDEFENGEIENADDFFSTLSAEHSVTDIDSGQEVTIDFDNEFPYTHPANISWDCETWGPDQVPVKYDSLQVIGEGYYYTSNLFEKEIIIKIPNRFSLYNDFGKVNRWDLEDGGWVEFRVRGMLITPPDGLVYYTSDADSFVADSAKVSGHYFYVDSDQNGFFETVYILNDWYDTDESGTPIYTVMSIGLNYDGVHDFAPYERIYDSEIEVDNFDTLAQESVMFGSDWVYNFRHLEAEELLQKFETKLEEYNLKPKDQIFEIYKLVQSSEHNSDFSELFYEIRHKTYDTAWEQYKTQLIGDIAEQVFMSVTAALLSATVEAILTGTTFGFGWPAAKAAATLTYLSVYTLMTYFYIDIDLAKAEAEKRSQAFYSVSSDNREPTSLNEKNLLDRVLGDSMAAALIGHPGGYYTEVSGGEPGNAYTGQLLVSPPNLLRMLYSFDGFSDLLWENFWNMGESDPDAYAALDFDDINLDYFLLTSELPSYNQNPYYTYENADGIFDLYNMYALNTLGYLETQISQASNGQYDSIRATCIDGRPQYEFINSTLYQAVTPQSVLYRPIVLSQERYDQLQPAPGSLVVKARSKDYSNTIGIDAYAMSDVERKVYATKVPLNDNGFEYTIRQISIDVVKYNIYTGFSYFVKGLIVNESDYSIDLGNLYFNKSIEELVSEKDSGFEDFLSDALAHEIIESKIYFDVRIVFDVFIPDTTEESSSLALAQATSYAIMDYFNQYVFAETTANSISEIAYTETMTFWSTLISAPLVFFGSWAVKGTESMMGEASVELVKQGVLTQKQAIRQMLLSSFVGMALGPIKEVFEEIIKDGFTEALVENIVDIAGGTDALGFWVSSFVTSRRETTGALGQLALGDASLAFGDANLKTKLSLIAARIRGDTNTIAEITQRVQQDIKQKQDAADLKREQMSSWQKLFSSSFFKGFLMFLPSVLYGSFSFVALKGLNDMIDSTESAVPKAYARFQSEVQAYRKGKLIGWVGTKDTLVNNLQDQMKKPADLEAAKPAINEKYKASQETQRENPPLAAFLSNLNPNPKTESKKSLANKFNEIRSNTYFESTDQFDDSQLSGEETQADRIQVIEKKAEASDLEMSISIGDVFEGLFPEHDKATINYIYSKLFDPEHDQDNPIATLNRLIYRSDLALEARNLLETTKYNGLDIILDGGINYRVLAILKNKYDNGEEFSKLERIIADVATFYMGGPQIRYDGGYDLDTIREYEEETGKKAFLSNSPTKAFKKWFSARQVRDEIREKIDGLVKTVVDDYMDSLDRSKLQFRQLHFQDYVSDPSDVDRIYSNRKKYVWTGIVYRITELKEENGKIVEGRKLYGFSMDDLESRWRWYKEQALNPDTDNQRIHDAIFDIDERILYGEIDGDIDDWFKREVVEVHWNEHSMRQREIGWINKDNTQDPAIGFNTKPGGEGGPKIHIPIRLLIECIAKGLKVSEIRIELKNHGIFTSWKTVSKRINERFGSFFEARKILLKPVIKQLIKEGYKRQDINKGFKTKTKDFLIVLLPRLFEVPTYTALRKKYLLEKVTAILETGSQVLTYGKIQSSLPQFGKYEIKLLIEGKWGGISNAKTQFGREIAIYLFRIGASDEHILRRLGFSEYPKSKNTIDRIFKRLFNGMTADEAREHFTSGYRNIEGHFIWYSDLDNY